MEQEWSTEQLRALIAHYEDALARRWQWEKTWQNCYAHALPQRQKFGFQNAGAAAAYDDIYDATAPDAVDQLAASLLGNLTPPWTPWFGMKAGADLDEEAAARLRPVLEKITKKIQSHIDQSNFAVEIHQCYLDLVVGGTATLMLEEAPAGEFSAFRFSAVPLADTVLEEGGSGYLDRFYRRYSLSGAQLLKRYAGEATDDVVKSRVGRDLQSRHDVLETIIPEAGGYRLTAILMDERKPLLLQTGLFDRHPAISFRWTKSPGENYGRSPVMKALPDIRTANKIVELVLKNASIAVTGIWQADDDGVLNPANIELVPGAIIPKAVGSQGLKPLEMPARFDVSELMLGDLRGRIRNALMVDRLGPVSAKSMTATEVLERSNENMLLLGATYGRLQTELLSPLIMRAFSILRRRGEIPDIALDGRTVAIDYRSPLAKAHGQRDLRNILMWLETIGSSGNSPAGQAAAMQVDGAAVIRHLAERLGVPGNFLKDPGEILDPEKLKQLALNVTDLQPEGDVPITELSEKITALTATETRDK